MDAFASDGWAWAQFAEAELGDVRRRRRAARIAAALTEAPGQSIPQLFSRRYDAKAAYALFSHPEATPDALQAGHRQQVRERLHEGGTLLLLEDTSDFSWPGNAPVAGLGPIGSRRAGLQGFQLHSVLALRWPDPPSALKPQRPPVEILGLLWQEYAVREHLTPGQPRRGRASAATTHVLETDLWLHATEAIGPAPAREGLRWVRIADRGADLYEFLQGCRSAGHGFVVRSARDRHLVGEETTPRLFARMRALPAIARWDLSLRSRPHRPARIAHLSLSSTPVLLRSPARPGSWHGRLAPVACTAIRVWEAEAPPGEEALEWILLSDSPVSSAQDVQVRAQQYAARWLIEEFHKALKLGLGAERLQLETAARLFAAIAIMSIVAIRLLALKESVRLQPEAPAREAGLNILELRLLELRLGRTLHTVGEVALALGRLGGHMNRSSDGYPGWITLWRGMQTLQAMAIGAHLALEHPRFGV